MISTLESVPLVPFPTLLCSLFSQVPLSCGFKGAATDLEPLSSLLGFFTCNKAFLYMFYLIVCVWISAV